MNTIDHDPNETPRHLQLGGWAAAGMLLLVILMVVALRFGVEWAFVYIPKYAVYILDFIGACLVTYFAYERIRRRRRENGFTAADAGTYPAGQEAEDKQGRPLR